MEGKGKHSTLDKLSSKGEICIAGSRIYVQEGIYDEFVKKAAKSAKGWVVGDPFEPHVHQGPQIDKNQFEKVLQYIEHGKRERATLLTGGKPCGKKHFYVEPTIFTDIKLATLTGHTFKVLYLAISPDGQMIATGADDEMLRFWNVFPSLKFYSEDGE